MSLLMCRYRVDIRIWYVWSWSSDCKWSTCCNLSSRGFAGSHIHYCHVDRWSNWIRGGRFHWKATNFLYSSLPFGLLCIVVQCLILWSEFNITISGNPEQFCMSRYVYSSSGVGGNFLSCCSFYFILIVTPRILLVYPHPLLSCHIHIAGLLSMFYLVSVNLNGNCWWCCSSQLLQYLKPPNLKPLQNYPTGQKQLRCVQPWWTLSGDHCWKL